MTVQDLSPLYDAMWPPPGTTATRGRHAESTLRRSNSTRFFRPKNERVAVVATLGTFLDPHADLLLS